MRLGRVCLRGSYELLGDVHDAIRGWCMTNGREIEGTNWEIYGHHEEDPARRRTDVFLLAADVGYRVCPLPDGRGS